MRLTRAVTHIRLCHANHPKIAALDALAAEYLRLCQAYTTYFCTEAQPEKYAAPRFDSPLSQRWQRVAIQQAAGIAQSWRSKYAAAYQDYLDRCHTYQEEPEGDPPQWKEWSTPVAREPVIQANANVALLQPAQDSSFDYWLRLSTLEIADTPRGLKPHGFSGELSDGMTASIPAASRLKAVPPPTRR